MNKRIYKVLVTKTDKTILEIQADSIEYAKSQGDVIGVVCQDCGKTYPIKCKGKYKFDSQIPTLPVWVCDNCI